jgi:hypothetical protein
MPPSFACVLLSYPILSYPILSIQSCARGWGIINPTMLGARAPDAWKRYPLVTNTSSISRSISRKIRVSPHACTSSTPARCCVGGISFSATAVAGYRRLRSYVSCRFLSLSTPFAHVTISHRMTIKKLAIILALHLKRFKYHRRYGGP